MERVVTVADLHDPTAAVKDRAYWLSRTPEERWAAVESLRRQYYGEVTEGFQRVYRVAQIKRG